MRVTWINSGNIYRAIFSWGANGVRVEFEAYEGQGRAATNINPTEQELDAHLDRCLPDTAQWGSLSVTVRKLVEAGLTAGMLNTAHEDRDLMLAVWSTLRQVAPGRLTAPGKAVVL